jgi:hypothetical protein
LEMQKDGREKEQEKRELKEKRVAGEDKCC